MVRTIRIGNAETRSIRELIVAEEATVGQVVGELGCSGMTLTRRDRYGVEHALDLEDPLFRERPDCFGSGEPGDPDAFAAYGLAAVPPASE